MAGSIPQDKEDEPMDAGEMLVAEANLSQRAEYLKQLGIKVEELHDFKQIVEKKQSVNHLSNTIKNTGVGIVLGSAIGAGLSAMAGDYSAVAAIMGGVSGAGSALTYSLTRSKTPMLDFQLKAYNNYLAVMEARVQSASDQLQAQQQAAAPIEPPSGLPAQAPAPGRSLQG